MKLRTCSSALLWMLVVAAVDGASTRAATGSRVDTSRAVQVGRDAIEKLGITVEPAVASHYLRQIEGLGVIVSHEAIAQAAFELHSAQEAAALSRSAAERSQRLADTPGAIAIDAREALSQKAAVDELSVGLSRQKLTAAYGAGAPWARPGREGLLEPVASGRTRLLRVTFALGALERRSPGSLRVRHLLASTSEQGSEVTSIWQAPADSAMPGRSFFALLNDADFQEGERVEVTAPIGGSESGVNVPATALVMSGGSYWCYVEKAPGSFQRVAVDTSRITMQGYFVSSGIAPGDPIVTAAAGLLLAQETGAATEGD